MLLMGNKKRRVRARKSRHAVRPEDVTRVGAEEEGRRRRDLAAWSMEEVRFRSADPLRNRARRFSLLLLPPCLVTLDRQRARVRRSKDRAREHPALDRPS